MVRKMLNVTSMAKLAPSGNLRSPSSTTISTSKTSCRTTRMKMNEPSVSRMKTRRELTRQVPKLSRIRSPKTTRRKKRGKSDGSSSSLVDDQLQLELDHNMSSSKSKPTGFRYRATSPQSFGLTSRDILMADDSSLNQYAGLKKLAAFRDTDKKRKDQKHLGKKARLRKWRKDVFGNEEGVQTAEVIPLKTDSHEDREADDEDGGVNIVTGGKKKRRRKNKKQKTGDVEV